MAKVSVIIPIYNVEKYLSQCLDSLIGQTLKDIEIICVNDCSADNSSEILKEYAERDSRIIIVNHSENAGWTNSVKDGLAKAGGEYIMFVDSDDWLEPDACEKAYTQINKNNDDVVFFGLKLYYDAYDIFQNNNERLRAFQSSFPEGESFSLKDLNIPFMSNGEIWYKIYSHEFLRNTNIMDFCGHFFAGDIVLHTKMLTVAKSVSYINSALYNYRIRGDLSNTISNPLNYKHFVENRAKAYEIIKALKDDYFMKWYIVAHINSHIARYNDWGTANLKTSYDYYKLVHNDFKKLAKEYNIDEIKQYIYKYDKFQKLTYGNYISAVLLPWILQTIFSAKNDRLHKYKLITILGIKLKLKINKK